MATNDFRIHEYAAGSVPVVTWQVDDRTTTSALTINAGEFVKSYSDGTPYVIPLVDADVTIGTDLCVMGLSTKASTETSTVNGVVDVYMPLPGIVYEGKALAPTAIDTQAEIDALCGDYLVIDVAGTAPAVYTLDTAAGHGTANAFCVIGGDPVKKVLYFILASDCTYLAGARRASALT